MSYNELWEPIADGKEVLFENVESLEDFEVHLDKSKSFPHVAVYYPHHARFQVYDVIIAVYDEHKTRRLVGYQLKEGREIPEDPGNLCEVSVLIRGAPARKKNELRNWKIASDAQIVSFWASLERHLIRKNGAKWEVARKSNPQQETCSKETCGKESKENFEINHPRPLSAVLRVRFKHDAYILLVHTIRSKKNVASLDTMSFRPRQSHNMSLWLSHMNLPAQRT